MSNENESVKDFLNNFQFAPVDQPQGEEGAINGSPDEPIEEDSGDIENQEPDDAAKNAGGGDSSGDKGEGADVGEDAESTKGEKKKESPDQDKTRQKYYTPEEIKGIKGIDQVDMSKFPPEMKGIVDALKEKDRVADSKFREAAEKRKAADALVNEIENLKKEISEIKSKKKEEDDEDLDELDPAGKEARETKKRLDQLEEKLLKATSVQEEARINEFAKNKMSEVDRAFESSGLGKEYLPDYEREVWVNWEIAKAQGVEPPSPADIATQLKSTIDKRFSKESLAELAKKRPELFVDIQKAAIEQWLDKKSKDKGVTISSKNTAPKIPQKKGEPETMDEFWEGFKFET